MKPWDGTIGKNYPFKNFSFLWGEKKEEIYGTTHAEGTAKENSSLLSQMLAHLLLLPKVTQLVSGGTRLQS